MACSKMSTATNPQVDLRHPQWWTLVIIATIVVLLLIAAFGPLLGLKFVDQVGNQLPGLAAVLAMVALLVERVTEIFVSIWRDPASDILEQQKDFYRHQQEISQQQIADLNKELNDEQPGEPRKTEITNKRTAYRNQIDSNIEEVKKIDLSLVAYKAKTRRLASLVGIALGVLASGIGFRVLQNLVTFDAIAGTPQAQFFYAVDVLLTGTLLAGGSVAVHQVFALYDTFMESSRQRADGTK
jgi:hypothetical protein